MTPEALADAASLLYLDHLAVTLVEALAAAGVRAVLLKGASLRDLLYDPGETRTYSDVDLLVGHPSVAAAVALLEQHGFRDRFEGAGAAETVPYGREYRGERAYVDLHWTLPGVTVADEVAWEELTRRTDRLALRGGQVEVLTDAGRTLHVALHCAHNGVGSARPLDDLYRAVRRLPTGVWEQAGAMAEELGALPSFVAGLSLDPAGRELVDALGIQVDIPTGVALRAGAPPPLAVGLDRLLTTPGIRAKAVCLAREVVPTPAGLRYWSPLARRGRAGLIAAYIWRPFYLAVHAPAAVVAWRRARSMSSSSGS
jgi:hypothetical protein